jgi:formate/nitrite transporter FocA (FNT family)
MALYDPHEEKLPLREMAGGFAFALALLLILIVGMLI